MAHEPVVHSSAINKCRAGLPLRTGNESFDFARGVKYERSCSCEHVGPHPGKSNRNVSDQCTRCLMNVGLDTKVSSGSESLFRVSIVAIACLSSEPAVDMETVVQ